MIARALRLATVLVAAIALLAWLAPSEDGTRAPSGATPAALSADWLSIPDRSATATPAAPSPVSEIPLPPLEQLHVSVPDLGIDLPLAYGDVERDVPRDRYPGNTPERLALVFPGSAPLRTGGNTYIYAHARAGMFLSLWNVRLNEVVTIYAPGRPDVLLRYVVVRIVPRVDPTDTSWLDPSGPERLTLQTSTGPNAGDPRFIVIAARELVSPAGSTMP
jgi:sortase (surface protein transpeptidase)